MVLIRSALFTVPCLPSRVLPWPQHRAAAFAEPFGSTTTVLASSRTPEHQPKLIRSDLRRRPCLAVDSIVLPDPQSTNTTYWEGYAQAHGTSAPVRWKREDWTTWTRQGSGFLSDSRGLPLNVLLTSCKPQHTSVCVPDWADTTHTNQELPSVSWALKTEESAMMRDCGVDDARADPHTCGRSYRMIVKDEVQVRTSAALSRLSTQSPDPGPPFCLKRQLVLKWLLSTEPGGTRPTSYGTTHVDKTDQLRLSPGFSGFYWFAHNTKTSPQTRVLEALTDLWTLCGDLMKNLQMNLYTHTSLTTVKPTKPKLSVGLYSNELSPGFMTQLKPSSGPGCASYTVIEEIQSTLRKHFCQGHQETLTCAWIVW